MWESFKKSNKKLFLFNKKQNLFKLLGLPTSFADCGNGNNDVIRSGTCMTNNNGQGMEIRQSCDCGFKLIFQNDGNLVVYAANGNVIWHANSHNKGGVKACMQGDGRFVIYTVNDSPIWYSQWYIQNGDTGAVGLIQGDANFVVYTGYNTPTAQARWSSGKLANCNGTPKTTGGSGNVYLPPWATAKSPGFTIFNWKF
jgi:hypothetical protein